MEMQAAVKEIEGADKNTDSRSSILECPGGPGDSKDTMQYHQQPVLWPWHGKERNERRRGDGLAKGLNSISHEETPGQSYSQFLVNFVMDMKSLFG